MKLYRVEARLKAPVALKRDRQSDRSETVQAIPGTTLRGALAALYLQQHGGVDDTFRLLFMNEQSCRFGPLDPAPHLYPLTMSACKRHPSAHPKQDQLAYRVALHLSHGKLREQIHMRYQVCSEQNCGADLKPYVGFWRKDGERISDRLSEAEYVAAHVGIDRTSGTAAPGIFYTLQALTPDADTSDGQPELFGWVRATDHAIHALRTMLEKEGGIIYLGHHRTRGYGCVELSLADQPTDELNLDRSAAEDWLTWNRRMITFVRESVDPGAIGFSPHEPLLDPERDTLFAIGLPAGAIAVDRMLRYSADLSAVIDWLPEFPDPAHLFPVEDRPRVTFGSSGQIRCVAAVTNFQLLRGWNAAHGLPRQDEWMVARGAVYVYWLRGSAEDRGQLFDRLMELQHQGVGLRRNEGFGHVRINDPIHRPQSIEEIGS